MTDDAVRDETRQPSRPKLYQMLGPGLITGAADDDPSGIATYSQVGAQFGYGLAWSLVFSYPLMATIQEISARIGRVTGLGIAGNLRRHYVHGDYSRSRIEGMREARQLTRIARGAWWLPLPRRMNRPPPPGWEAYRVARGLRPLPGASRSMSPGAHAGHRAEGKPRDP